MSTTAAFELFEILRIELFADPDAAGWAVSPRICSLWVGVAVPMPIWAVANFVKRRKNSVSLFFMRDNEVGTKIGVNCKISTLKV